jgi:hypothetical protein
MTSITAHLRQQELTYFEHWRFAMRVACRLSASVLAFALHAMFPSIPIARRRDLEATAAYLAERNRWLEAGKGRPRVMPRPVFARLGRPVSVSGRLEV